MTTTKPLPPHGSEARYAGAVGRSGCRCRTCTTGWTRAGQRRKLARLEGRPATIPAAPITAHIATLYASHMTTGQIAHQAGVNPSTIIDHGRGAFPNIRRSTAEKILAVKPHQHGAVGYVPALGSTRRLRTLYAAGHGAYYIAAAHERLNPRSIEFIVDGARAKVLVAIRDAITAVYWDLSTRPGDSPSSRQRAEAEGWPGPDYWDADDFDNPDFVPAIQDTPRYIALAEDGLELEQRQGYGRQQAADRLGVTKEYLQASITRYRNSLREAA